MCFTIKDLYYPKHNDLTYLKRSFKLSRTNYQETIQKYILNYIIKELSKIFSDGIIESLLYIQ